MRLKLQTRFAKKGVAPFLKEEAKNFPDYASSTARPPGKTVAALGSKQASSFFLQKRTKKLLRMALPVSVPSGCHALHGRSLQPQGFIIKSFLLLFCKKEGLSYACFSTGLSISHLNEANWYAGCSRKKSLAIGWASTMQLMALIGNSVIGRFSTQDLASESRQYTSTS